MSYEALLAEKPDRNRDNVARTASYLELYALARANGAELPWLLMAHLVSRHAGYLMTDVAAQIGAGSFFKREALEELFSFLERANFLIFDDAWHHVLCHLMRAPKGERTARFMRDAWHRYETEPSSAASERRLLLDLVMNEQSYIERRVAHNARFARPLAMVGFFEAIGREARVALPLTDARIKVGGFARLERRVETGRRIFDEVLADASRREAIFAWALAHPHTGSRTVIDSRVQSLTLRDEWPVERVRDLWSEIHAPPEPDAEWF